MITDAAAPPVDEAALASERLRFLDAAADFPEPYRTIIAKVADPDAGPCRHCADEAAGRSS